MIARATFPPGMSIEHSTRFEQLMKRRTIKRLATLEDLLARFTSGERVLLYIFSILLTGSVLTIFASVSDALSVPVPTHGGSITEGLVGPARFVNPVIALSQSDNDLATLVYSGLTRTLPNGTIIPDLASSYDISPDGTIYTFHLRPDATFQDGKPVLAADIVFTIQKAKDPEIKSPHRADWEGVSIATPDSHTVVFTLAHPYTPFLENTSLGILPKHLWENVSDQEFPFSTLNTHAVGSGPFRISKIDTDSTDVPTSVTLTPFKKFTLGEAYLSSIVFEFYPNNDALLKAYKSGDIDSIAGVSPADVASLRSDKARIVYVALPRTFGIFLNQTKNPVLADASVRAALNAAVDKTTLMQNVLGGYGIALNGPIPPGILFDIGPATPTVFPATQASSTPTVDTNAVRAILTKGGWTFDTTQQVWKKNKDILQLSLATADEPELAATAEAVADAWRAIGVKVEVHVYPLSELNTVVIRPRAYDAILFGEVIGRTVDLFAFWHSSQRNDPGLNLALYANPKTDTILTQARAATDKHTRVKLYEQFSTAIDLDTPAVFLYAPDFIYIIPSRLLGVELGTLTSPSDRFSDAYEWHINSQRVWDVLSNKEDISL